MGAVAGRVGSWPQVLAPASSRAARLRPAIEDRVLFTGTIPAEVQRVCANAPHAYVLRHVENGAVMNEFSHEGEFIGVGLVIQCRQQAVTQEENVMRMPAVKRAASVWTAVMRTGLLAITLAVLGMSPQARADGPWCAHYGGGNGGNNCGFYSFNQCMAALSGNGGYCAQNPFYASRKRSHRSED